MKVVADNNDFEQRRCRLRVEYALRQLTANLLRVTRGAGRPSEVPAQALSLLEPCQEFRQVGHDAPDFNHAVHTIVRGALQMTASRLLGQLTQERTGENEFYDRIDDFQRERAAERARLMGRPPPDRGRE
jgi:hypothetical protein